MADHCGQGGRASAFSRFVMIRPVQTTRPRSVNTAASAMVRGRRVVRNDPDIGPITRERRGSARCPRCGPRKKPELRGIPWCGIDNPGVVPTPEIQPGEAGRAEIVERSESAGDQGGPMFGRCLIASRARLPSAGSSSFVVGSDRADHRCPHFRYPSRRSFAWRLPRWSTRPSTSGHVFEYRPVGAPTPRL
jgi:hypothetical protein